jgi:hypothetical protein
LSTFTTRRNFAFNDRYSWERGDVAKRVVTASFAGLLVVLTTGVASASYAAESSKPAGPHVPTSGGTVHVTGYSDNDGPTSRVVVSGVIGDFGEALRNGSDSELDLRLTRGSFTLGITGLESEIAKAISGHFPPNATTGSGEVTVSGASAIDSGSGTGAYKGLSGTLTLTITINEVESPPRCPTTDTAPFLAQTVFITGSGTVAFQP